MIRKSPRDLEESPYGESRVILWDQQRFVVLHSWATLSEMSSSERLENVTPSPCSGCGRVPHRSTLDREFVAGTIYSRWKGEDFEEYAFYCRPCAAEATRDFGYAREDEGSRDP